MSNPPDKPASSVAAAATTAGGIPIDAPCPQCGYNLRGLRARIAAPPLAPEPPPSPPSRPEAPATAAIPEPPQPPAIVDVSNPQPAPAAGPARLMITCPECGHVADAVELVTRRWTGPWWRAPGYNRLAWPVAWIVLGTLVGSIVLGPWTVAGTGMEALIQGAAGTVLLAGWAAIIYRTAMWWGPRGGYTMVAAMHGIMALYLAALPLLLLGIVLTVEGSRHHWGELALGIAFLAAALASGFLGGRAERAVAQRCIRRYLAGPTKS